MNTYRHGLGQWHWPGLHGASTEFLYQGNQIVRPRAKYTLVDREHALFVVLDEMVRGLGRFARLFESNDQPGGR